MNGPETPPNRSRTALGILVAVGISVVVLCRWVRRSGKVLYFHEAETPKGWPTLTEVGVIEVKEYPEYREAVATKIDGSDSSRKQGPMFRTLFNHIQRNQIAMTGPVTMEYAQPDSQAMTSMAFLYRTTEIGKLGDDGQVIVRESAPRKYASLGFRGSFNDANFRRGLALVKAWIATNPEWRADGPPRFLGYNSPFILWFWRYGEIQIPIIESGKN